MAWETVDLLPLITSDFNGSDYVMEDSSGYRNPGTGNLNDNITPVQIETSFWDSYEANDYIIGDSNAGIRFNGTGNSGISLMLSGTVIVTISLNSGWGLKPFVLVAGINRETERGSIFMVNRYYDFPEGASSYPDTYRNDAQGGFLNDNSVYQALTGIIASPYNWTAVESISGRLGTLNLTQIKSDSINDGAAVTGASSSSFDNLVEANNLKVLIDDILPEPEPTGTDVTVRYTINSASAGSYTYCKLVVKKNKIPNDVTDGDKIINIDPTAVSVLVKNLKGHTKYYFVIFVKDSNDIEASSEPKSITTQGAVIPEEYQPYLDLLALTAWGTNSDMNLLAYANRRGNSSTSIVSSDHSFITSGNFNANQYNYGFSVLELSTINISTDPVTVLYTCNVAEYDIIKTSGRDMWGVYSENGNGADYIQTWGSITGVSSPGNTDGLRFNPTTSFNSLGDCLAYLTQHFRHVNVKVDGEYWLKLD